MTVVCNTVVNAAGLRAQDVSRRIEGIPTVAEFMDRRLTPAMNTCVAVARRQEVLAERIANTNSLLRTRVGIAQEKQNSKILESMNARAAQLGMSRTRFIDAAGLSSDNVASATETRNKANASLLDLYA